MSNKLSLLVKRIEGSKQVRDEIIEMLTNEIVALEKIYSSSYWECSLYRAVVCNEDILEYLENIAQK